MFCCFSTPCQAILANILEYQIFWNIIPISLQIFWNISPIFVIFNPMPGYPWKYMEYQKYGISFVAYIHIDTILFPTATVNDDDDKIGLILKKLEWKDMFN